MHWAAMTTTSIQYSTIQLVLLSRLLATDHTIVYRPKLSGSIYGSANGFFNICEDWVMIYVLFSCVVFDGGPSSAGEGTDSGGYPERERGITLIPWLMKPGGSIPHS